MIHWYRLAQIGAAATLFVGLAAAQSPQPSGQAAETIPAAPADAASAGRERLEAVCGACHDPHLVDGQKRDLAGWQELIDSMIAKGAQVTDADYEVIAKYLATRD